MAGKTHRVVVTDHGGPDVLEIVEEPMPEPRSGQARVAVQAAGVSAFDLMYRRWRHLPGSPRLPFTLGEDVVGVVDRVGHGVTSVREGQMVAAATWDLGIGGGYCEHICLPESALVAVPEGVDPAQAVCLVVNYLTAHLHLHVFGKVRAGERVLVHGAAGGVGTALLELARLARAEVYGTASERGRDVVTSLDAVFIDYTREDFVERIRTLTGDGVDVVIDNVGGARHLRRSYRTLREGGRLVWLGSAAVEEHGLHVGFTSVVMSRLLALWPDGRQVPSCPTADEYARSNPSWYRDTLRELLVLLAGKKLSPIVAARIPLVEAVRAHELLEHGGHRGKFVLVPSRDAAA